MYITKNYTEKKPNSLAKMINQLNSYQQNLGNKIEKDMKHYINQIGKYGYFITNDYIKQCPFTNNVINMYIGNGKMKKVNAGKFMGELLKSVIYHSYNSSKKQFIIHHLSSEKTNIYFRVK